MRARKILRRQSFLCLLQRYRLPLFTVAHKQCNLVAARLNAKDGQKRLSPTLPRSRSATAAANLPECSRLVACGGVKSASKIQLKIREAESAPRSAIDASCSNIQFLSR